MRKASIMAKLWRIYKRREKGGRRAQDSRSLSARFHEEKKDVR
jgi:hypothetical protein